MSGSEFSEKALFDFEYLRFSLLNQKASFVLAFGSLIVGILFGVLDVAPVAANKSIFGLWLIATGIAAFLISDILSIFIIFPRYLSGDLTKRENLLRATSVIKKQNGSFGRLLEFALLCLLFGITAISFSLLSFLFSTDFLIFSGWFLAFAIPIATRLILFRDEQTIYSKLKTQK